MKTILTVLVVAVGVPMLSGQVMRDRHALALSKGTHPSPQKMSAPRLQRSTAAPVSAPHSTNTTAQQLSAMEHRTQRIGRNQARPKKTSMPPAFKPQPEPTTGGFDAGPYLHKQKAMTSTTQSRGNRGPSRTPGFRGVR